MDEAGRRRAAALAAFARSDMLRSLADAVAADPDAALGRALAEGADQFGKFPPSLEPMVAASVEAALAAGADPLARPTGTSTCLELAIHRAALRPALALARAARARLAEQPRGFDSLLCVAAKMGMEELAIELLGWMPAAERKAKASSAALLWATAATGSGICQALLDAGADPATADSKGRASIWLAASVGALPLLATMLARGASPDMAAADGSTPLMAAAEAGNLEAVKYLLVAGARIDVVDKEGRGVREWGARHFQSLGAMIEAERAHREARDIEESVPTSRHRGPSRAL